MEAGDEAQIDYLVNRDEAVIRAAREFWMCGLPLRGIED